MAPGNRERGSVGLWDLLLVLSSTMLIAGGIAEARIAKAGLVVFALTVVIGVVLAVANAWAVHTAGNRIYAYLRRDPEAREWKYFLALYLPLLVWIPSALLLGAYVAERFIRVVI